MGGQFSLKKWKTTGCGLRHLNRKRNKVHRIQILQEDDQHSITPRSDETGSPLPGGSNGINGGESSQQLQVNTKFFCDGRDVSDEIDDGTSRQERDADIKFYCNGRDVSDEVEEYIEDPPNGMNGFVIPGDIPGVVEGGIVTAPVVRRDTANRRVRRRYSSNQMHRPVPFLVSGSELEPIAEEEEEGSPVLIVIDLD